MGIVPTGVPRSGCSGAEGDDDEELAAEHFTSFGLTEPGEPTVGHSWPAQSGKGWLGAHASDGCGRSVQVQQAGAPMPGDRAVGGGFGGIYCFASPP